MKETKNHSALYLNGDKAKQDLLNLLDERNSHFHNILVDGEINIDVPVIDGDNVTSTFKTIKIYGKKMKVSVEEHKIHHATVKL